MSYTNGPFTILTRIATEELEPYRIVILSTDPTAVEYPAAQFDGALFGITMHHADLGAPIDVCVGGFCQLRVDGNATNLTLGDFIANHDALGYGQKIGATASTVYKHIAIAWEAATADGALISVEICKGTYTTPAS